jgi:uncharacterized membrane protein YeaQ/YmgE (transglycosylase-associated protein family)
VAGGLGAVIASMVMKQTTSTSSLQHFDLLGYAISAVILVCTIFVYHISEMVKAKQ